MEQVPSKYHIIFDLNPNALLINAYRRVILQDDIPDLKRLALGFAISLGTFIVGYYLFKKMESGFADHI
jgi:ABC-type polysaccharide/polyol phosphate export permease